MNSCIAFKIILRFHKSIETVLMSAGIESSLLCCHQFLAFSVYCTKYHLSGPWYLTHLSYSRWYLAQSDGQSHWSR